MRCKCGQQATHFEDSAGYPLEDPLCDLCFVEADLDEARFAEACVTDFGLPLYSDGLMPGLV